MNKFHPKDINCQIAIEELTDLFNQGQYDMIHVQKVIARHPDCEKELMELHHTWVALDEIDYPSPSHRMDANMYKLLHEVQEEPSTKKPMNHSAKRRSLVWIWSSVAASLIVGFLAGGWFMDKRSYNQVHQVTAPDVSNKEMVVYTNYQSSSATDRLKQVNDIKSKTQPDSHILDALFQSLIQDPNINVRLSAVEVLTHFGEIPEARNYLIKAIPFQTSPLVQIALADATLLLQDESALPAWKKLLSSDQVELEVKQDLEETIKQIY